MNATPIAASSVSSSNPGVAHQSESSLLSTVTVTVPSRNAPNAAVTVYEPDELGAVIVTAPFPSV